MREQVRESGKRNVAEPERLVELVLDDWKSRPQPESGDNDLPPRPQPGLFHSADGQGWARTPVGRHLECHAVRSSSFRELLLRQVYRKSGEAPSKTTIGRMIDLLDAEARFDGPEEDTHVRVAGDTTKIIIDLGDAEWRSILVTPIGYQLLDYHPIAFRRPAGMRSLPEPGESAPIRRELIHPSLDEEGWCLVAAWLVGCFRPWGAYTLASFVAEAGAGKTVLADRLVSLTDPSEAALRNPPRNERDVAAAVRDCRVLGYDNLSSIPAWLSDSFCRVATGITFAGRKLFSNSDEHRVAARQPIVVTSIPDVIDASDLRDRSLVVRLHQFKQDERESDKVLAEGWTSELRPKIFSSLLGALVMGLRRLPNVVLDEKMRMLDHLQWAVACAPGLGISDETMVRAHLQDRRDGAREAVGESVVGHAVQALVAEQETWEGTATQLIATLASHVTDEQKRSRDWPRGKARAMSGVMRRLAPDLRRTGISVQFSRRPGGNRERLIHLGRDPSAASPDRPDRPGRPQNGGASSSSTWGVSTERDGRDDGDCGDLKRMVREG